MSEHRRAVCVRCGHWREDYSKICPSCGHRPEGEGLLVAWLLSDENLGEAELEEASARVKAGRSVRPSRRMLERARRALGKHFASDPGLSGAELLGLTLLSLAFTALPGLMLWAWWRTHRPRAATQSLLVSLPVALASLGVVLWLRLA